MDLPGNPLPNVGPLVTIEQYQEQEWRQFSADEIVLGDSMFQTIKTTYANHGLWDRIKAILKEAADKYLTPICDAIAALTFGILLGSKLGLITSFHDSPWEVHHCWWGLLVEWLGQWLTDHTDWQGAGEFIKCFGAEFVIDDAVNHDILGAIYGRNDTSWDHRLFTWIYTFCQVRLSFTIPC